MAWIRRTQSPAHRLPSYINGGDPFSIYSLQSLPCKVMSSTSSTSYPPFVAILIGFRRLLIGILFQKPSWKGGNPAWKRSVYQFLIFFMIGCLLGLTPFSELDDLHHRSNKFSLDIRSLRWQYVITDGSGDVSLGNRVSETVRAEGIASSKPFIDKQFNFTALQLLIDRKVDLAPRKQLIIVTPMCNHAFQAFYLNRLGQILRLVPPSLLWIVVEMNSASPDAGILRRIGVTYRHLVCKNNSTNVEDRRVHQRNTALEHIELHRFDGIVYFADDDNVYSLELFKQMRELSSFGTWPVAMLSQNKNQVVVEGPVCNGSQVIGWHINAISKRLRRFHVNMSGFAFNSTTLWGPRRWHRIISDPIRQLGTVKELFQETTFIEQVVEDENQMEAIPSGRSRVMNWHLHLKAHGLINPRGWLLQKNLDVVASFKQ